MTPNIQTGTVSLGIEVRVLTDDGKCPLARVSFAPGEVVGPISVGRDGEWSIDAPGVAPMALEIHFDGEALHVAAIAPGVRLAGRPLGRDWTKVALPGDIRFGTARMMVLKGIDPSGKRASSIREERARTPVPPPPSTSSSSRQKPSRSQMDSEGTVVEGQHRASMKNGFDDEEEMTAVAARPLSETAATPIYDLSDPRTFAAPRQPHVARDSDDEEKTTVTMRPELPADRHESAFKDERTAVGPRPVLPPSVVVAADPDLARDYEVRTAVGPRPVLPASIPGSLAAAFHAPIAPAVPISAHGPIAARAPIAAGAVTPAPETRREGHRAIVAPAPMGNVPPAIGSSRDVAANDSTAPTASDSRQAPTVVLKNRRLRGRVLTLAFRGALALAAVVLVVDLASGSRNTAPAAAIAASASATSLTAPSNASNAARNPGQAAPTARAQVKAPLASAGARVAPTGNVAPNAAPAGSPHATIAAAIAATPATDPAAVASSIAPNAPSAQAAAPTPNAKDAKDAKDAKARSKTASAKDGAVVAGSARGEKSLEARAVEAAAAGAFRDAAAIYGTLARTAPTVPAYAEAARILAERGNGGTRSTAF